MKNYKFKIAKHFEYIGINIKITNSSSFIRFINRYFKQKVLFILNLLTPMSFLA